jgi:hypothetical protein
MTEKISFMTLTAARLFVFMFLLFFEIMPTSVFVLIASDIVQVAATLLPFTVAFMIILVSTDITFGLPVADDDGAERLSKRRRDMGDKLLSAIRRNIALIVVTILGKGFCAWFVADQRWVPVIATHVVVFAVGVLMASCVIALGEVMDMFRYLSTGADLSLRVRQALKLRE